MNDANTGDFRFCTFYYQISFTFEVNFNYARGQSLKNLATKHLNFLCKMDYLPNGLAWITTILWVLSTPKAKKYPSVDQNKNILAVKFR
jgi:hypothetical protein